MSVLIESFLYVIFGDCVTKIKCLIAINFFYYMDYCMKYYWLCGCLLRPLWVWICGSFTILLVCKYLVEVAALITWLHFYYWQLFVVCELVVLLSIWCELVYVLFQALCTETQPTITIQFLHYIVLRFIIGWLHCVEWAWLQFFLANLVYLYLSLNFWSRLEEVVSCAARNN